MGKMIKMNKSKYAYKKRLVCSLCLSLSFKKSYKKFKCDNCKEIFDKPICVKLFHKGVRCIDNNVDSRLNRYDKNKGLIYYG